MPIIEQIPTNASGKITSTPYINAVIFVGFFASLAYFALRIPAEMRLIGPTTQRISQMSLFVPTYAAAIAGPIDMAANAIR